MKKYLFLLVALLTLVGKAVSQNPWQKITSLNQSNCSIVTYGTDGTAFAAYNSYDGKSGKLYRSMDDGITWDLVSTTDWPRITTITTTTANEVFVGTTEAGIFHSTDNGSTWSAFPIDKKYLEIYGSATSANGVLYVACGAGLLFRSADSGKTWANISPTPAVGWTEVLCVCPNGTIIVSGYSTGIYRSTNDGATWDTVRDEGSTSLVVNSNGDIFCISSGYRGEAYGVLRSTDNGQTWMQVHSGLPDSAVACLVCNKRGDVFAGHRTGIYRYSTAENTWTKISNNFYHKTIDALACSPGHTLLAGTERDGLLRSSNDGVLWESTQYPVDYNMTISSILLQDKANIFVGVSSGNFLYTSNDSGRTWRTASDGIEAYNGLTVLAMNKGNGHLYAGSDEGFFRSSNGGRTWEKKNPGSERVEVQAIAVKPNGEIIIGTYFRGVYRTMNEGDEWTAVNDGITYLNIESLIALPNGDLLAGSGSVPLGDNSVYRSTDDGEHWHKVWNTSCPAIIQHPSGKVFLLAPRLYSGMQAMVSSDNGETWSNPRLDQYPSMYGVTQLGINSAGELFAGGYDYFRSQDEGRHWVEPTRDVQLPGEPSIESMAIDLADYIYMGTSDGLYKSSRPMVTSVGDRGTMGARIFNLNQNYPNPFNPSTTIAFSIPSRAHVSLKVFDLMGRDVATIVSETLPAGNYSCQWNASEFPSGVYFYRLTAGAYTETKRLMLVK